jgi:hypothetical protein
VHLLVCDNKWNISDLFPQQCRLSLFHHLSFIRYKRLFFEHEQTISTAVAVKLHTPCTKTELKPRTTKVVLFAYYSLPIGSHRRFGGAFWVHLHKLRNLRVSEKASIFITTAAGTSHLFMLVVLVPFTDSWKWIRFHYTQTVICYGKLV